MSSKRAPTMKNARLNRVTCLSQLNAEDFFSAIALPGTLVGTSQITEHVRWTNEKPLSTSHTRRSLKHTHFIAN